MAGFDDDDEEEEEDEVKGAVKRLVSFGEDAGLQAWARPSRARLETKTFMMMIYSLFLFVYSLDKPRRTPKNEPMQYAIMQW